QLFTDDVVQPGSGSLADVRRGSGLHQHTPNFAHEFLFESQYRKGMVPIVTEVLSRSLEEFGEWDRHRGEEFVFLLEGTIEISVGPPQPERLRAGDSCYFD